MTHEPRFTSRKEKKILVSAIMRKIEAEILADIDAGLADDFDTATEAIVWKAEEYREAEQRLFRTTV